MTVPVALRSARIVGLTAVVLAVIVVGVLGMWRPWAPLPAASPVGAGSDASVIAPAPLVLPEHPLVLIFGDSWTYGSAASNPALGYAYLLADLLDGKSMVDGVRGSGYLKPGLDGPTFGERIAVLDPTLNPDLVIIQGSINDRRMGAAGYRDAVTSAWDALTGIYPKAQIVVLGPAPHELPVGTATARIDADLATLATARGWSYISPVQREWITAQNYLDVIDVEIGRKHPSTEGHRFLAEKVVEALDELRDAAVTEAGGTKSPLEQ